MSLLGVVRTYKTIRNFLLHIVNKEFFVFLFFLALSAGFWWMLTLNETYEKDVYVPIKMTGVPSNVVITDPLPDSVKVTLRDKGYSLIPYLYGDAIQPIYFNFNDYVDTSSKGSVTQADILRAVKAMLYGGTVIVAVKADKLDFTYNYGLSKMVKVYIDGQIRPADTYYLARMAMSPDSVKVYANKEVLDGIHAVYTDQFNLIGFTDTITRDIKLKKIRGVKMVPDHIRVCFYPDILTEKIVTVPITSINTPEGMTLRTFPNTVNVKVVVGRGRVNSIRPDDFRVIVDYNDVSKQPSDKCTLELQTVPKGVANASLETLQVDYLIESNK